MPTKVSHRHPKVTQFPVQHRLQRHTTSVTLPLSPKAIQHLHCHLTHIPTQPPPFLGLPICTRSGEGLEHSIHSLDLTREVVSKRQGQGPIQVAQNGDKHI